MHDLEHTKKSSKLFGVLGRHQNLHCVISTLVRLQFSPKEITRCLCMSNITNSIFKRFMQIAIECSQLRGDRYLSSAYESSLRKLDSPGLV